MTERSQIALALAAGCVLVSIPAMAQPQEASVTLSFSRHETLSTRCPDAATFRDMVRSRLGYSPFKASAQDKLDVSLRPTPSGIRGAMKLNRAGAAANRRSLDAGREECDELATSLAFAVALAIDPEAVQRQASGEPAVEPKPEPKPEPPPNPPPAPTPRPTPPPAPAPAADDDQSSGLRPFMTLGGVVAGNLVPGLSGGPTLGLGVAGSSLSLALEGGFLLPASRSESFGGVEASAIQLGLVPCALARPSQALRLDFCLATSLGIVRSEGQDVNESATATDLTLSAGPRAGLTLMPWQAFGFSLYGGVPLQIVRADLEIDDAGTQRSVWQQPRLAFAAGAALVLAPF